MTAIQWSLKIANQCVMFLFGGHIEFLGSPSLMPIYVGNFSRGLQLIKFCMVQTYRWKLELPHYTGSPSYPQK